MAYDERDGRRARGPGWRGDDSFGGGWGNQVARRPRERDSYGADLGHGDYLHGGPGLDPEAGEVHFGRAGIGDFGHDIGTATRFGDPARAFGIRHRDPHYADWRDRRMAELDRDYDEYRRESQMRFDREFSGWRARRAEQRAALSRVGEQMEVTGADGGHVGTVDCTRGDRIILSRGDEAAGGVHHAIPCGWVDRVDDKVVLNIPAAEARARWQTEARSRALFEREDIGRRGPHVLNRSFAGTYPDDD